jgi:predicted transcriptional regulator
MDSSAGTLELLARSDSRIELLRALADGGPLDRYDLEDRLDVSRRTVTRALDALEEEGYVGERESGYALTAFGRLSVRAYREYSEEVSLLERYRPLLRDLDAGRFDLDPDLLRGADLIVASEASPYAILDRVLELRAEATRIREFAPGIEDKSVRQLADRLRDGADIAVELVLPPGALEAALSHPEYGDDHRVAREADSVDFFVYPDRFAAFLGVLDDTVALAAGSGGRPSALAVSDRPDLREWALDRFRTFRREATPLADGP